MKSESIDTQKMVDAWIMDVVTIDDERWRRLKRNSEHLVGTGVWKMWEDENGVYITFTDDHNDQVKDVVLMEGCQALSGERLVYFTNVHYEGLNYGLVLFKSMVYQPLEDIEQTAPGVTEETKPEVEG